MKSQLILTAAMAAAVAMPQAAWSASEPKAPPSGAQAKAPATLGSAAELAPLPDGGWLALDKNALRLLDAGGAERARYAVRGKQLDIRPQPGGVLVTLIDSNTERAVAMDADLRTGQLRVQPPFPAPAFAAEAACLYRDAQQISYLFLIAKDGQGEQWMLDGADRKLVRRLAMPPHVKHCRVDDATGTLFASESGFGLWAYSADAEGAGRREALALRRPYGKLAGGPGRLELVPGGLAMQDTDGRQLLFAYRNGAWREQAARPPLAQPGKTKATKPGAQAEVPPPVIVLPQAQTEPVARLGDAADDPAIWVHPGNPSASRVLGTNKKQGLLVYDLQGKQTQLLESGRLNNVDLRQNVLLDGARHDLALATQRDDNSIVLYTIDGAGAVAETARFPTGMDKIYGICVYQPAAGGLEAFVNDKDGTFQHYRIGRKDGSYTSTLLRSFKVASQPEGCVADDRSGRLFIGEEKRGVWAMSAGRDGGQAMSMILPVGGVLTADVEGMSLYHGRKGSYLVVSSQGSNSYVVIDAAAPHKVRGSFRIGVNMAAGIDGASETDGLDVSSANLGGAYAEGMLVVQDGYKRLPDGPQNFKYVAWSDIARALQLP